MDEVWFQRLPYEEQLKFKRKEQLVALKTAEAAAAQVEFEHQRALQAEEREPLRKIEEEKTKEIRAAKAQKEADRRAALTQAARDEEDEIARVTPLWQNYERQTYGYVLEPEDLARYERPPPLQGWPSWDRPELREDFSSGPARRTWKLAGTQLWRSGTRSRLRGIGE